MPTAYELLSTEECDDVLFVDLDSRRIIIPKNVSVLGVESDDETRVLHFQMPRYYCEIDLSEFDIRVIYRNAINEGDLYLVIDPVIEDDLIKFDWTVGRHAFAKAGDVKFSISLRDIFEGIVRREFNTTFATLPVLNGLEPDESLLNAVYDYIEQWDSALADSVDRIKQGIVDKGEEVMFEIDDAVLQYVEEHSDKLHGPIGDTGPTGRRGNGIIQISTYPMHNVETDNSGNYRDYYTISLDDVLSESGVEEVYPGDTIQCDKYQYIVERIKYETVELSSDLIDLSGPQGETIKSIDRTSGTGAAGTYDTYTITTNLGKKYTFKVYNGANGNGAGDMVKSVYDPQARNTDIFAYVDQKVGESGGNQDFSGLALGDNPTGGVNNDTVETWSALGFGVAWISEWNQVNDQPAQYAFIINYVHDSDVFQILRDQTNGATYFRSGDNVNSWFSSWTRIVTTDDNDYIRVGGINASETITVGSEESAMIIYTNGIGDTNSKLWIDASGEAYFTEVYARQKKLATEEFVTESIGDIASILDAINGEVV